MSWLLITLWLLIIGTAGGLLLKKRFRVAGWSVLVLTELLLLVLTAGTAICWDAPETGGEADYGLLLGCALEDGQASEELLRRCETALLWMEQNPKLLLVVSGGDPAGQGISEAAVMAAWLKNHGADPERLLLEDQSRDTRENLLFGKQLLHTLERETDTVAVITSEYHQTRASFLARRNGQHAICVSSRTPMPDHLFAALREVYAFGSEALEAIF